MNDFVFYGLLILSIIGIAVNIARIFGYNPK